MLFILSKNTKIIILTVLGADVSKSTMLREISFKARCQFLSINVINSVIFF